MKIPATDAASEAARKSKMTTRGTLTPEVLAAARDEPTSFVSKPNLVLVRTRWPTRNMSSMTTTTNGTGPIERRKILVNAAPAVPGAVSG